MISVFTQRIYSFSSNFVGWERNIGSIWNERKNTPVQRMLPVTAEKEDYTNYSKCVRFCYCLRFIYFTVWAACILWMWKYQNWKNRSSGVCCIRWKFIMTKASVWFWWEVCCGWSAVFRHTVKVTITVCPAMSLVLPNGAKCGHSMKSMPQGQKKQSPVCLRKIKCYRKMCVSATTRIPFAIITLWLSVAVVPVRQHSFWHPI